MARFTALLCALVAAATSAGAASIANRGGVVPAVPGTSESLITFFTNYNYGGSSVTFVDELTTGCIGATAPFVKSLSSVKLERTDIACNLWNSANCQGPAGIVITGDVPNLGVYGFNDMMVSYNCYSTA